MTKGWPDPQRHGAPINPKMDGAHQVVYRNQCVEVCLWNADLEAWITPHGERRSAFYQASLSSYIGPFISPVDHRDMAEAAVQRFKNDFTRELNDILLDRVTPAPLRSGVTRAVNLLLGYRKNHFDQNLTLRDDIQEMTGWINASTSVLNFIENPVIQTTLKRKIDQINMIRSNLTHEYYSLGT